MHAGIFIGDYAKNMTFKKDNSGASMNQMELLRTNGTRFCLWNLKSSVIPRLNLDGQIGRRKTKKEVKIVDVTISGDERKGSRKD